MDAVMECECRVAYGSRDVSALKCGYDIEPRVPGTGRLRFMDVKRRHSDGNTITVTKNEILTDPRQAGRVLLGRCRVDGERAAEPTCVQCPFRREPDFGVTGVTYATDALMEQSAAAGQGRAS